MKKVHGFTKASVQAAICRKSFYQFVRRYWDIIIVAEPVWNWHIEYLCDELQLVAERIFPHDWVDEKGEKQHGPEPKLYDLVINVPPGSTKTTICSILFPAWVWTRMQEARTISGSYAGPVALDNCRKSRLVIESDRYKAMFPEVELRADQNAKGFYETTKGGDRVGVGAGGAITGRHAHFLLVDDPINPKEVRSEVEILNTNLWMKETLSTRKVDKKVSVTILIMQRLHREDPSGTMLAEADDSNPVRHICLPAEVSDNVKPARLKRRYKDGLMDPVRMPQSVLDREKKILGPYGYAGQYEQSPTPLGGGMFKFEKIELATPPTLWKRKVRYWDKAGTKDGGAFTAGVLMGEDAEGCFWILDVVRGQWESGEREKIIKQTAVADGRGITIGVEQEPGSGGKESAQSTVKNLAGFTVMVDRVTGDKVTRADPFSVQVNVGSVKAVKGAAWWEAFRAEMQFFPFSKRKDQIDAASGAFALLNTIRLRLGAL